MICLDSALRLSRQGTPTMAKNSFHAGKKGFGSSNSNNAGFAGRGGVASKGTGKGKPTGTPKGPASHTQMQGNKVPQSCHGKYC